MAMAIAKFDRWKQISPAYFDQVMPAYFEIGSNLARTHDGNAANEMILKRLEAATPTVLDEILKENVETAYIDVYHYDTALKEDIDRAFVCARPQQFTRRVTK
jgi:hypothetical protein